MRTMWLLARNDLRMLVRTRSMLILLLLYGVLIAALLGGMLLQQGDPRIAYVNLDTTGRTVKIGSSKFNVDDYVRRTEEHGVKVVTLGYDEAMRALQEGQVAGVMVIPQGTVAKLTTQLSSVKIKFYTGDSPLGKVVAQRVRGTIYSINLSISNALVKENSEYLDTLVTGGRVTVNGDSFDMYGLDPTKSDLEDARVELVDAGAPDELVDRIDRAIKFASTAGSAIGLADNALSATAAPVRLKHISDDGKSPLLTALALSFLLSVLIAFVCIILSAASLAAERDEAVLGRLLRGLASRGEIVGSKIVSGMVIAVATTAVLFLAFALLAPQAWARLPLLLLAVLIAGAACASVGTLIAVIARDARTATLGGLLLILPLIPMSLSSSAGSVGSVISIVANLFPVEPARTLFNAVLFEHHPWQAFGFGALHLGAITLVCALATRHWLHRLA